MSSDRDAFSSVRRTLLFAAGGMLPTVWLVVGLPWLGGGGAFAGTSALVPLTLLVAGAAVGGAVAGRGLGPSPRCRLALAVAFGIGFWPLFAVVATVPALTGREGVGEMASVYLPSAAVSGVVVAVTAAAILGRPWRRVATASLAGGGAGVSGGLWLVATAAVAAASMAESGLRDVVVGLVGGGGATGLSAALVGRWLSRRG